MRCGSIFDVPRKKARISELESLSAQPGFWDNQEKAKKLQQERGSHELVITTIEREAKALEDAMLLAELGIEASDDSVEPEILELIKGVESGLAKMELRRMMAGKYDQNNAILEIHSGAGGTDSQDWAQMLLRMYTRWCERAGFEIEEIDSQAGEEAGLKSVTIIVRGEWSYGWLRAEEGVHRLVRISPFDANHRRQTAFAAVSVFPEIEDELVVEIDWDTETREDRLRSGGAGGQHVNKTESAIRLTHLATGIVVMSQSERSQHKNRSTARKILTARLFAHMEAVKKAELEKLSGTKAEVGFGSQIRSYVNHPYQMVKDHRTEYEKTNFDGVLDGDLDGFMEAYLLKNAAGTKGIDTTGIAPT